MDINVVALVKGSERYVLIYDDEHGMDALRQLGKLATDPDLSFTWYDAAVLSKRIREAAAAAREAEKKSKPRRFIIDDECNGV